MAEGDDNPVPGPLREIGAQQGEDGRFLRVERRLAEPQDSAVTARGFAVLASVAPLLSGDRSDEIRAQMGAPVTVLELQGRPGA